MQETAQTETCYFHLNTISLHPPASPSITQVHLSLITPVIFIPLSLPFVSSLHSFPSLHSLHLSLIIYYFCRSCPLNPTPPLFSRTFLAPGVFSLFTTSSLLSPCAHAPFFTSTPPLTSDFCHSLLITHLHSLYFLSLFFFYRPPLLLCPSPPPYPSVSSLIFHLNPLVSFHDSHVFYSPPLLLIPSAVMVSSAFLSMHLTFMTHTLISPIPSTTVLCRGQKMWPLSLTKL